MAIVLRQGRLTLGCGSRNLIFPGCAASHDARACSWPPMTYDVSATARHERILVRVAGAGTSEQLGHEEGGAVNSISGATEARCMQGPICGRSQSDEPLCSRRRRGRARATGPFAPDSATLPTDEWVVGVARGEDELGRGKPDTGEPLASKQCAWPQSPPIAWRLSRTCRPVRRPRERMNPQRDSIAQCII